MDNLRIIDVYGLKRLCSLNKEDQIYQNFDLTEFIRVFVIVALASTSFLFLLLIITAPNVYLPTYILGLVISFVAFILVNYKSCIERLVTKMFFKKGQHELFVNATVVVSELTPFIIDHSTVKVKMLYTAINSDTILITPIDEPDYKITIRFESQWALVRFFSYCQVPE